VPRQHKTAVVVDDEATQRAWMRGILRRLGFGVAEAATCREALELTAQRQQIDLFIIDLRLPDGSGHELSRELRALQPGSTVLLVSGTAGAEICKYFDTSLQQVQFLHKPFQASELAQRIREMFAKPGKPLIANASAGVQNRSEPAD